MTPSVACRKALLGWGLVLAAIAEPAHAQDATPLEPAPVNAAPVAATEAAIRVQLDQAKLIRMPERTSTLVVGNPLIADVTVQPGGLLVVTGKSYGVTNVIALDRGGAVLMNSSVEVRGPGGSVVVVYRGIERESYSCTPDCERRITLGDTPNYFNATLSQSGTLNTQAQGTAQPPK